MNADNICLDSLSARVLSAVFEVSNTLGAGFLEKVYQRALLRELRPPSTVGGPPSRKSSQLMLSIP